MDTKIETDRLVLSELSLDDFPFIIMLLNSPGWLKFIGDRGVKTEEQAISYLLNGPIKSYADHGHGLYKVVEKMSGLPVGLCGLLKRDTLEYPDLGFALLPQFMGKGYANEASKATIEFAKTILGFITLQAIAMPENSSSIKLLKNLDFQYQSKFRNLQGEELALFELHL